MSDAVLKKGDSNTNTLSDKELDAAVLPPDQPLNELTSSSCADSNTLSVKELGASLPPPPPPPPPPPYKPSAQGFVDFYPPPSQDPLTVWGAPPPGRSSWSPVAIKLPSTSILLPEPKPGKRSLYIQSPTPSNLEYRRTFHPPYTPSPTYSPTAPGGYSYSQSQDAMHAKPLLFAKIALHCYNLEKGTHFERLGLPRDYDQTLEARDPARNYTCRFETSVRLATENKDCFHVVTTRCRPLPPPPPPGEDGFQCGFDTLSVDELFKGNMPDWLPDDYATSTQLLLQYYEMKESEVEQAKEWLHLYAELALYTKKQTDPFMFERSKPLELGKVVVQTRGVVDSLKEVELLDNAVFFITFKTSCGDVWKGIIRRTRDGIPEHLSLEAKCFM
ncbi:BnaC02g23980D [Brassica napus]|uniref:BnaC02g23980D protein n=1 Tax=Brassica napus TaxID=3708 RepID=A0A078G716_BRANA|nr:BnaC02g23980D [Brassica napus]